MIRWLLLTAACSVLLCSPPSSLPCPKAYPVSEVQHATILSVLRWALAGFLLRELNSALDAWAENRWRWKDGCSWDWKNEVAVVTGGSSGIGAMLVQKLTAHGIKVAILDLEPLSYELQDDAKALVRLYQCNIASRDAVHAAAEAIRSEHGSPSILINNAGIGNANTILDITPERLKTIFDVNVLSHWNTTQEFLPAMIAQKKGHVMSTASLAAFVGLAGMVDYSCTKAALTAFHEGLTQELKHRYHCPQVKTSIVYPNWTKTRLIKAIEKGIKSTRAPIMEPEDVAGVMVKQIIAAKSGQLILGPSLAASVRAMPIWIQEVIRDRMAYVVTGNATTAAA